MSTGEVWVQYNDGSKVKVQPGPGAAALTYTDPQGQEMRWALSYIHNYCSDSTT